jgi:hypothetical protein
MPVADSDSHPLTIRTASTPYGCSNGDRSAEFYWAPVRIYNPDGSFEMGSKPIKHTMSRECRYDKSLIDPRCSDCKHQGTGEAYSARISAAVAKQK